MGSTDHVSAAARRSRSVRRSAAADRSPRIVALVPAHDEEQGICTTVASLRAQVGADDHFEVLVIADNCTDATAARAQAAGAVVWIRDVPGMRGKGHALAWGIERL